MLEEEIKEVANEIETEEITERFKREYSQLCARLDKLNEELYKHDKGILEYTLNSPIDLLRKQADFMTGYREIMLQRAIYEGIDPETDL